MESSSAIDHNAKPPVISPLLQEEQLFVLSSSHRQQIETDLEFRRRLFASRIPSAAEAKTINGMLIQAVSALEQLEEECRILRLCVEEYGYLVAPIRRVPNEILSKIMLDCRPVHYVFRSGVSTAIQLGRVCRLWRDVSLSIPALWSSINLTCYPKIVHGFRAHPNASPQLLHLHLARSQPALLTIKIDLNELPYEAAAGLINQLVSHSDRWHNLQISPLRSELLQLMPTHLHALEYLSLHASASNDLPSFQIAPKLRSVKLYGYVGFHFHDRLPWRQITILSLWDDVKHFLVLLRFCPQVQILNMIHGFDREEEPDESSVVNLPHCHIFELEVMNSLCDTPEKSYESFKKFFSSLRLPAARSVVLRDTALRDSQGGSRWPEPWPIRHLASFLEHTEALKELTLHGIILDGDECLPDSDDREFHLTTLLKSVPYLDTLTICPPEFSKDSDRHSLHDVRFLGSLIHALSLPPQNQPSNTLVPRLRSLVLDQLNLYHWPWAGGWHTLESMIRSRHKSICHNQEQTPGLQHFLLSNVSCPDSDASQFRVGLHRLRDEGIDITVTLYDDDDSEDDTGDSEQAALETDDGLDSGSDTMGRNLEDEDDDSDQV